MYPNTQWKSTINYLGKNKFFSFIIDPKYGGEKLSVNHLSQVLTKITTKNPALGVTVMVPNSLGPGELLQEYGTEPRKNIFLDLLRVNTFRVLVLPVPIMVRTRRKN